MVFLILCCQITVLFFFDLRRFAASSKGPSAAVILQ
jgi:hypothetical protein